MVQNLQTIHLFFFQLEQNQFFLQQILENL